MVEYHFLLSLPRAEHLVLSPRDDLGDGGGGGGGGGQGGHARHGQRGHGLDWGGKNGSDGTHDLRRGKCE